MTEPTTTDNRQPAPANNSGFDFNQPTIISLCYLGSFITGGITGLVGVVLGHVWQGENKDSWTASHLTYLIRTFWIAMVISVAYWAITGVLMLVLIGFLLLPLAAILFPALAIWVGVRSVMSLIKAQKQEPMPDPQTLLF